MTLLIHRKLLRPETDITILLNYFSELVADHSFCDLCFVPWCVNLCSIILSVGNYVLSFVATFFHSAVEHGDIPFEVSSNSVNIAVGKDGSLFSHNVWCSAERTVRSFRRFSAGFVLPVWHTLQIKNRIKSVFPLIKN